MEHVVFLEMYFEFCMESFRFIRELHRLFRAVEEMKEILTESGNAANDSNSFGSN